MKAERWAWVQAARSARRRGLFGPWRPERCPWAASLGGQRGPLVSVTQLRPALAQYLLVVKLWLGRCVCPSVPMSWNGSLQFAMLGGAGSVRTEQASKAASPTAVSRGSCRHHDKCSPEPLSLS